mgnify:CR=1 FL=1
MKKPIILLFVLLCGNMFASAQIKIMLESEVEKKKNESAAAKQQAAKPSYQIYADDYIPVKKNTGEKVIPKKTDVRPVEKELTYAEITRKRQQRRKEGKLTDLEEIQAQLKELEHLKWLFWKIFNSWFIFRSLFYIFDQKSNWFENIF